MIAELSSLVSHFPGSANQTRCFNHILNLAVKSILCQFDSKTASDADATDALSDLARELDLALPDDEEEVDEDELPGLADIEDSDNVPEDEDDAADGLSAEEVGELAESLVPVRMMLTKVHNFSDCPQRISC